MLEDVDLNWWAIVVATFVPTAVGMVWYRALAGPWLRAVGKTREELGGAKVGYATAVVGAFVTAYVLARVVDWAGATSFGDGLLVGLFVWVGFVATATAVNGIFAGRPWSLWAIDGGFHLANLLAMGAILAVWD